METYAMINFEETPGRTISRLHISTQREIRLEGPTTTHFQCPIPRINSKMKSNTLIPPVSRMSLGNAHHYEKEKKKNIHTQRTDAHSSPSQSSSGAGWGPASPTASVGRWIGFLVRISERHRRRRPTLCVCVYCFGLLCAAVVFTRRCLFVEVDKLCALYSKRAVNWQEISLRLKSGKDDGRWTMMDDTMIWVCSLSRSLTFLSHLERMLVSAEHTDRRGPGRVYYDTSLN